MIAHLTKALLIFVAVTQFLPIAGILGVPTLQALYAIEITDPNLEVLLRHRAVLFGILGALIGIAAFRPPLQTLAIGVAIAMIGSFLALWAMADATNVALDRLAAIDLAALLAVGAAALLKIRVEGAQAGATS